ncbi:MAG: prolipoprotein diacylglyceryl transferase family protein [Terracidiphilus sp.]|jgi:phosphatidylglycerol:prolipoprotein diacylglycerol transferase
MIPYIPLPFWPHELNSFGLMLWVASVVAAIILDRAFKRARLSADAVGMVAIALVAGVVGSKIWHVLDSLDEFRAGGWGVLWDNAGFAWYGGLVFGISALVLMGWRAKIGGLRILDLTAPAAAIGYGVGRIGCFLSGDGCYGIVIRPIHLLGHTFHPWGMAFPHGIEPIMAPVYPTPLYELVAGLLIGSWLWWRLGKPHATGVIVGQYLALSGIARFLVEFIRRNPKVLWGLSNAQLASAGAVLVGIALVAWASWRPAVPLDQAPEPVGKPA